MKITDTHVYFYSETFSNWYSNYEQFKDPLQGNIPFDNTEQAFMHYKARFFGDQVKALQIEAETNPARVKMLGRQIKGYDDKAWSCVRFGYMTYVNLLKYQQNPEYKKELLETENRKLVEASRQDKIWGVGWYHTDIEILDESKWLGTNLLGESLMVVRSMLK